MTALQKLADETRNQFVQGKRDNGDSYWYRESSEQDWIYEMCHKAHGDMLPDDWRYAFIVEALDALAESEDPDDIKLEADIYTQSLTNWLASRADRYSYCDEAAEEFGQPLTMIEMLQFGQAYEKREVLDAVRSFLEGMIDDQEV